MKKYIILLSIIVVQMPIFAQQYTASVLQNENYILNPKEYLSEIPKEYIQSGILIDRALYKHTLLEVNGYDKVTSVSYAEWASMYRSIEYANLDTNYISNFKTLNTLNRLYYKSQNVHPIAVFDFSFQRIKEEAISNGELIETDNLL